MATQRAGRGLDLIFFCVALLQTGFGPLLVVHLTTQSWNQAEIGLLLGLGTVAAMVTQVPGGMLIDRLGAKRMGLLGLAIIGTTNAVASIAPHTWLALLMRALMGLGTGISFVGGSDYIRKSGAGGVAQGFYGGIGLAGGGIAVKVVAATMVMVSGVVLETGTRVPPPAGTLNRKPASELTSSSPCIVPAINARTTCAVITVDNR